MERIEARKLAEKLVQACRHHKAPSRTLSDAVSKLVTHDWTDNDPRWETFAWPHWAENEDAANALAELVLREDHVFSFRSCVTNFEGRDYTHKAGEGAKGNGFGTFCNHGPTGIVGTILKIWRTRELY